MANIKSAIKRMKQNQKRRLANRAVRTGVRSAVKAARTALAAGGADSPAAVLRAIRDLDRAASRGVVHRNTAARKKSALARRLHTLRQG